jgi:galactokinase
VFEPVEFDLGASIPPHPDGHWVTSPRRRAQALAPAPQGFDAAVSGTIPQASGLSSSSALVVACALAVAHASSVEVAPLDLMARLAEGKHYVGRARRDGSGDLARRTRGLDHANQLRSAALDARDHAGRLAVRGGLQRRADAEVDGRARGLQQPHAECAQAFASVARIHLPDLARTWREMTARTPLEDLLLAAHRMLPDTLMRRFRHVVTEADQVEIAENAMRSGERAPSAS